MQNHNSNKSELGEKTILLVEDEVIIALAETYRLEKLGYIVITVYKWK